MFAKQTSSKIRLSLSPQQCLVEFPRPSAFPLPGEAKFAGPPALPDTLLQMDDCLSASVCDLASVTNIIRSDVGLTAQLLRLAASDIESSPEEMIPLSEIVVHVGAGLLKEILKRTPTLANVSLKDGACSAYERCGMHSRLAALVAEERARSYGVSPEEAYLAGLLQNLGELELLRDATRNDTTDSRAIGGQMARAWGFPKTLVDVITGDRGACRSRQSRALLDIAADADVWASRLEFLAARESMAVRTRESILRTHRN